MARWHGKAEKGEDMMLIDPTKINAMPLVMGPLFDRENRPGLVYADTENLVLQYRTDIEAVRAVLPECYEPAEDPAVRVIFMAGNGYRLATVQVAARYAGEEDQVEGDCVLVMFENATTPIITGREHLGIPKLYADISPVRTLSNDHLRCEASLWGHLLFGIDLAPPLKNQNALVRREAARRSSRWPSLGYKYIASLDGPPDADYPTIMWSDYKIERLWLGEAGEFYFGNPGENDIGYFKPVIDALKALPMLEITMTSRSWGSMVLRYDRCRRLR
jgi:acetoacetate decarboxylase